MIRKQMIVVVLALFLLSAGTVLSFAGDAESHVSHHPVATRDAGRESGNCMAENRMPGTGMIQGMMEGMTQAGEAYRNGRCGTIREGFQEMHPETCGMSPSRDVRKGECMV